MTSSAIRFECNKKKIIPSSHRRPSVFMSGNISPGTRKLTFEMSWNENFYPVKTIRGWIQSFLYNMAVGQGQMKFCVTPVGVLAFLVIVSRKMKVEREEETHEKNFKVFFNALFCVMPKVSFKSRLLNHFKMWINV